MKKSFPIFVLLMFAFARNTCSNEYVTCDASYGKHGRTCFIHQEISTENATISDDPPCVNENICGLISPLQFKSITKISISDNEKVKYLPVNVSETFPNLKYYSASNCSITKISKINFRGLNLLISLNLNHNQIETINRDVFSDLTSLTSLSLAHNKIKYIEHGAFFWVTELVAVNLSFNLCISEETVFQDTNNNGREIFLSTAYEKCRRQPEKQ